MHQTNTQILEEDLEKRIIHGLSCEWEVALWVLDENYAHQMKRPLFCLSDMKHQLGAWDSVKREISLSRSFVINHPWDAVKEVLIHEMAHQFVTEVFNLKDETPHGNAFRQACRLLRANPKASGKYEPLQCRVGNEANRTDDKIMLKIKKLMALAESCNKYEAEFAMAKSRELIKKYNIDLIERNEDRQFFSLFVGKPALRHFREEYCLSHLLIDFYFIQGLWVPAYVLGKGKMGRVLEISGTAKNVEIAAYVYDYVNHFIDAQWREYDNKKKMGRYRKTDFAVGVIEGFRSKLEIQDKVSQISKKRSLILVNDAGLDKYMNYRYPRVRCFSRNAAVYDENVLADGMNIGKKMVISKGITKKSEKQTLLIGI